MILTGVLPVRVICYFINKRLSVIKFFVLAEIGKFYWFCNNLLFTISGGMTINSCSAVKYKLKMRKNTVALLIMFSLILSSCGHRSNSDLQSRITEKFTGQWKFHLGDLDSAYIKELNDSSWQSINLPHDWSINETYNIDNPGGHGTKFMIGGVGWYRKYFFIPEKDKEKRFEITFDGVYQNSTVWINGHLLGNRPMGYISFKYNITPYLVFGKENILSVKVDNSEQPNSRWYTGSGIYRNVWITKTNKTYIDDRGFFVTTPNLSEKVAQIKISSIIRNTHNSLKVIKVLSEIFETSGKKIGESISQVTVNGNSDLSVIQEVLIDNPSLWSVENPALYIVKQTLKENENILDDYRIETGFRYFKFDANNGFFLNNKFLKIKGVCMHHDLGALGAAINIRAIERQLQILKEMGCNAIRTAHNPPAPELLQLCDKMGFLVMNETFDMWKRKKTEKDYSIYWDKWHKQDLHDHIVRDRNHPSVIMWSIGNEIPEQWSGEGGEIALELSGIIKDLDPTRPITAGNNHPAPGNKIISSGALDIIGFNYAHDDFENFHNWYPNKVFIATETTSALATRGSYDMPSDSIRKWPERWDLLLLDGNADNSCSAYDNCHAPWGSTHEKTWKLIKKHNFLSGMFIWTGFDYLGEPTPYIWPSRSSYFGIVDLAGFPKDIYYMYQSEWTNKTVLHIFPHWNWEPGEIVDVWAYYNNADEVELFLNNKSLGKRSKSADDLHVYWRVPFEKGTIKAISRKNNVEIVVKEIHTAGKASTIKAKADRAEISAGGDDLSFITVDIVDSSGNLVPDANNLVSINIIGNAEIAGVDNGCQTNHDAFNDNKIRAFNGKCLVIIRSGNNPGKVEISLSSENLKHEIVTLKVI